jgi:hypothetical protein
VAGAALSSPIPLGKFGYTCREMGTIKRVMIDKISGKASYAALSFCGFLGICDDHYPLSWQS